MFPKLLIIFTKTSPQKVNTSFWVTAVSVMISVTTVKMETLCSRFYAVISGTSGDINMGSSEECLELKN